MATTHKTPGVYVEEIAHFPPSVAPVATAIPAFIGYTEIAQHPDDGDLTLKPRRISSMAEYERYFGRAQKEVAVSVHVTITTTPEPKQAPKARLPSAKRSKHIMYYALQMYFANGGGPCYIVSVGPYKLPVGSALTLAELQSGLGQLMKEDEPTLIVVPEAQNITSIDDFKNLQTNALQQCHELQDRFVIMDVHGGHLSMSDPNADLISAIGNFRTGGIGNEHLKYGAAYAPNITTVLDFDIDASQTSVSILTDGGAPVVDNLQNLKGSKKDVYDLALAAIRDMSCILPPSSALAGIYAAVDRDRGVWKAPANVRINAVVEPTIKLTKVEQDQMKIDATAGKSVNAIRSFNGKDTLVWGARTLAGNDDEWRYVNVRRFFIFVQESVRKATSQFVFEPNDANTWAKVQVMLENFLTTLWRQGALQGAKPEHAFYVAVGLGKTMTPLDINEGRMIVEIGMAAMRPAEFIVLRFSLRMPEP